MSDSTSGPLSAVLTTRSARGARTNPTAARSALGLSSTRSIAASVRGAASTASSAASVAWPASEPAARTAARGATAPNRTAASSGRITVPSVPNRSWRTSRIPTARLPYGSRRSVTRTG